MTTTSTSIAEEVSPDLVERLRGHLSLKVSHPHFCIIADDCYEAADAIESLQAENDDLKHDNERLMNSLTGEVNEIERLSAEGETLLAALAAANARVLELEREKEEVVLQLSQCTCTFAVNTFDGKEMSRLVCARCARLAAIAAAKA